MCFLLLTFFFKVYLVLNKEVVAKTMLLFLEYLTGSSLLAIANLTLFLVGVEENTNVKKRDKKQQEQYLSVNIKRNRL